MKAWITKDGFGRIELHLAMPKKVGEYWSSSSRTEVPDKYRDDFRELIPGSPAIEMDVVGKQQSPWHPYPAEKPPQIRPEISTKVLAHVPWGECCSCYYKDGEWNGCPDLWAKKIDKWMEIPE